MKINQLRVEHLAKHFGTRTVVVDLSLHVKNGEVVGLLGPNGAGKTTSFYMIVGLTSVDAGRIWLDQLDMTDMPIHKRAQVGIGYLPQESSVFRQLSVTQNIMAILETRADLNYTARKRQLEEILTGLRIDHVRDTQGLALSGGERRRVEIGRALATEPKFMLLDEPFAGIDPISIIDIQRIILDLAARGIGILITDHNVRETLGICERSYIINEGKVIASGSADEILTNASVREVYLGESFRL